MSIGNASPMQIYREFKIVTVFSLWDSKIIIYSTFYHEVETIELDGNGRTSCQITSKERNCYAEMRWYFSLYDIILRNVRDILEIYADNKYFKYLCTLKIYSCKRFYVAYNIICF